MKHEYLSFFKKNESKICSCQIFVVPLQREM